MVIAIVLLDSSFQFTNYKNMEISSFCRESETNLTLPDPLKFSQERSMPGATCKNRPVACVFPFTYKVLTVNFLTLNYGNMELLKRFPARISMRHHVLSRVRFTTLARTWTAMCCGAPQRSTGTAPRSTTSGASATWPLAPATVRRVRGNLFSDSCGFFDLCLGGLLE